MISISCSGAKVRFYQESIVGSGTLKLALGCRASEDGFILLSPEGFNVTQEEATFSPLQRDNQTLILDHEFQMLFENNKNETLDMLKSMGPLESGIEINRLLGDLKKVKLDNFKYKIITYGGLGTSIGLGLALALGVVTLILLRKKWYVVRHPTAEGRNREGRPSTISEVNEGLELEPLNPSEILSRPHIRRTVWTQKPPCRVEMFIFFYVSFIHVGCILYIYIISI